MTLRKILGLLAVLVLLPAAGLPAQQSITMKEDVVVAENETMDNVFTIGGSVVVRGRVKESVVAIGGTVLISGEVGDSVVGIGTEVTLRPDALVQGDVVVIGGVLEKDPGSTVGGDTVFFRIGEIGERIFKDDALRGILSISLIPALLILKLIAFVLWLFLALFTAAVFPRQIEAASNHLRRGFWPAFGLGLLGFIVFVTLLVLFALLSLVVIGLPFLLALLFAALAIQVFGRVVVFHFFGASLLRGMGSRQPSVLGAALLGVLVITLAGFVPLIGFLFGVVINMLGWGLVLRTRFGTRVPA